MSVEQGDELQAARLMLGMSSDQTRETVSLAEGSFSAFDRMYSNSLNDPLSRHQDVLINFQNDETLLILDRLQDVTRKAMQLEVIRVATSRRISPRMSCL